MSTESAVIHGTFGSNLSDNFYSLRSRSGPIQWSVQAQPFKKHSGLVLRFLIFVLPFRLVFDRKVCLWIPSNYRLCVNDSKWVSSHELWTHMPLWEYKIRCVFRSVVMSAIISTTKMTRFWSIWGNVSTPYKAPFNRFRLGLSLG